MPKTHPNESGGPDQVIFSFRFQVNSTSDPDAVVGGYGIVDDIVNSSGVYTITLAKEFRFATCVNCQAGVENSTLEDADFTSWTQSTGALVVTTYTKATDVAAQAVEESTDDKWVHVSVTLCRSSALAPSTAI